MIRTIFQDGSCSVKGPVRIRFFQFSSHPTTQKEPNQMPLIVGSSRATRRSKFCRLFGGVQSNETQDERKRSTHNASNSNRNLFFVTHLVGVAEKRGREGGKKRSERYQSHFGKKNGGRSFPQLCLSELHVCSFRQSLFILTYVAKNWSGSLSRVNAGRSSSPPNKLISRRTVGAEVVPVDTTWVRGANADVDATHAIAKKRAM